MWEFVFTGLDYWTGLLDWTTGLAFHNNVGYQNKGGVNKMQPNKCPRFMPVGHSQQHAPSLVSNDSGKAKYKSHTRSFHCCTLTEAHLESTVAIPCV